jgi:hypothetical protein
MPLSRSQAICDRNVSGGIEITEPEVSSEW